MSSTVTSIKEEEDEARLPGFRFHPTDEELVGFYLRRKVEKRPISIELIKQADIYKYDPWDLPSKCAPACSNINFLFGRRFICLYFSHKIMISLSQNDRYDQIINSIIYEYFN